MNFVLQREKQEAERKRIEAQGVSDFQRIVAQGISQQLLEWKGIEATMEVAKSQNSESHRHRKSEERAAADFSQSINSRSGAALQCGPCCSFGPTEVGPYCSSIPSRGSVAGSAWL